MPKALRVTKESLAKAAMRANNWSEFYSELGFTGRPGGSSQHRIRKLIRDHEVDVAHFRVQRGPRTSWGTQELISAVASSTSWREVCGKLGSGHATVRKRCSEAGVSVAHFGPHSKRALPLPPTPSTARVSEKLRYAAEHVAVAWYTLHGFEVLVPADPCHTDLVACSGDGASIRVQVKSTTTDVFNLTRHVGTSRSASTTYGEDGIDEFFLVDANVKMYRVHIKDTEDAQTLSVSRCRDNEVTFDA